MESTAKKSRFIPRLNQFNDGTSENDPTLPFIALGVLSMEEQLDYLEAVCIIICEFLEIAIPVSIIVTPCQIIELR